MENVKVNKDQALSVLKRNREAHKAIFLEAVEGYRKKALELLAQHIKSIKAGKMEVVSIVLPKPEEHTKDYDCAIAMIEMSVDEHIVFKESCFREYMMDDWHWKRNFLANNSTYSNSAYLAFAAGNIYSSPNS